MIIIAALDYVSGTRWNLSILHSIPLLFCAYGRNRRLMWILTFFAVAAVFAGVMPKLVPDDPLNTARLFNRGLVSIQLLLIALILHLYLGTYRVLERSRHDLEEQHSELELNLAELAAREEEIARQNEELQSQTEELERQGEELRLANEELTRREKMLEALLSLSRDLATPVSRSETMDKICQTLGELINGPQAAAAILQRRGDQVHVVCHHGFVDGLQQESWPYKQSFAALVLERGRTGYLEDVALRPEVTIPVPRSGPPIKSVLAAPLRVEGRSVGSLEVYHADKHTWTDEQIALIESLAAQTSISLEAAELFERISEERRRLRTVLDTVPFGIGIVDAEAKKIIVNPAGSAMINVPAQTELDFPSLESRWKVFSNGQPIPFERRPVVRATKGEIVTGEECEFVLAGGRRLGVLVSAAPIHGRGDEITGAVVGWVDVTQLTALQAELDARRREAEESSMRKSRFLAAVSHDIRTPANAISLLAELMQRAATSPAMNSEIPEIASDLKRSALTLVDLVSDVLDITRFDSGKLDLQETIVSLRDLISDECRPLQQTAREKGLGFECPLPPASLTVRTDRVKLSRILTNLISNAIKFTDKGTITVSAGKNENGSVSIHVRDTGCGIPAQHLDRIFDEYFQLKNADRDRSKGSGLGLAITRRLIEAMGGIVTVQSEVGEGSTFTVTLPAKSLVGV
ncbi:MAG: GAF domain-containing protein [Anaerolineae bacterium]|nr:GAF domain-containing protein [Phycisphaerae bacterium]